ncbi:MAG: glycoside hydrolase family 16 protein [Verrucomicrobiota bacterium]
MKLLIVLWLTILAAPAADLPGWKLVWSDEFDHPGAPDPTKWGYEKGLIRNNEKQFYTEKRAENARVADGKLIIEARKEPMGGGEFTSASLISRGHGEWASGRIEVKAKLPAARGTWPAIWMLPTDHAKVPWPKCGEIDIMEHVGHDPGVIHGTLHCEAFNHIKHTQRSATLSVPSASSEFHTYSMEWSAERIVMHIDGKTYATFDHKPGDTIAEWPFDKPFYLILNLAIGGAWGGQNGVDDGAFPQRMEVDYVRVYQKNP